VIHRQETYRYIAISLVAVIAPLGAQLASALATPVGYQFDGLAFYQFGDPADLSPLALYHAGPDTSYFRITNNGLSTFTGNIGETAVSTAGGDFSFSLPVILAPTNSIVLSTSPESSNVGGFNGPANDPSNPQPGINIFMNGTVSLGANSEPVALSILDRDIHSGVPRTSPLGVTLDNYILQGGDPFGRDNGDDFETTQAPGPFQFSEQGVPEPASFVLLIIGAAAMIARRIAR
jgi:hypothetical protein